MVADDAQHVLGIRRIAGEGAELLRHLGGGGIGDAGHDRGQRAAIGAAGGRVIGDARGHQQAANVGVAEAEGAVLVGELGDLLRGELRHQDRDFEHHGPQPAGMLIALDIEAPVRLAELQQVHRGEVARRVVEEHVLRARIRGVDRPRRRAGVPVIDGGVELDAGIGAGPRGVADLLPQVAGLQRLRHLARGAGGEVPVGVRGHGIEEAVLDAHRIVGVLAGDGEVRLGSQSVS